jgi:putative nucleotidyltransferase with HDIG domain
MISLETISLEIDHLEPVSMSLPRLAELIDSADAGLDEIVKVIEYDVAVTANSIRLANSAYFATGFNVESVREAVQKLGIGRILEYAVGREVAARMRAACPGYGLDESELWEHSVASATAASLLPRFAKVTIHPATFTAALLHDMGKLVISRHIDIESRDEIRNYMELYKKTYIDAETAVLGCNHAQIGGLIARRWHFPIVLVDAIAWHHQPREKERENVVLDAVHICNSVAKVIGVGIGAEAMNMAASADAATALGLNPASLEALCAATNLELPKVLATYEEETHGV